MRNEKSRRLVITTMKTSKGYNGYLFTQQNTAYFLSKLCFCLPNGRTANGATMQFYMGWVYMREYLQFTSRIIHNANICILHSGIAFSKNSGRKKSTFYAILACLKTSTNARSIMGAATNCVWTFQAVTCVHATKGTSLLATRSDVKVK